MVYLYKNFLVINRIETKPQAIQIMNSINTGFVDGNNIWHVKNEQDKIIIVYGVEIIHGDTIQTDVNMKSNVSPIGYIKLYCQGSKVKISEINFRNSNDAKVYLNMLKNYLKKSIKDTGLSAQQIDAEEFVVYWSKVMYNTEVEKILTNIKFISDTTRRTYNFTSKRVLDISTPPQQVPVINLWGSSGTFPSFSHTF